MANVKLHFIKNAPRTAYYRNRTYTVPEDRGRHFVASGFAHYADNKLPDDVPNKEALVNAGIESIEAIRQITDLTEIKGIGKASAEKIKDYLSK